MTTPTAATEARGEALDHAHGTPEWYWALPGSEAETDGGELEWFPAYELADDAALTEWDWRGAGTGLQGGASLAQLEQVAEQRCGYPVVLTPATWAFGVGTPLRWVLAPGFLVTPKEPHSNCRSHERGSAHE